MPSIAEELDKLRETNKRLETRIDEIERRLDMVFPARVRQPSSPPPNLQQTTHNPPTK